MSLDKWIIYGLPGAFGIAGGHQFAQGKTLSGVGAAASGPFFAYNLSWGNSDVLKQSLLASGLGFGIGYLWGKRSV